MKMELTSIGVLTVLLHIAAAQYDCPAPWLDFGESCYKFVIYPASLISAEEVCRTDGANLVSVNSYEESVFVTGWLDNEDDSLDTWYTSGRQVDELTNEFFWEGDSTNVTGSLAWHDPSDLGEGDRIAYTYKNLLWGWELIEPTRDLPYICEIHKENIYRIIEEERDFLYGLSNTDPANILVGPQFTRQPEDFIYDVESVEDHLSLTCVADGNPQVGYSWLLQRDLQGVEINPAENNRYTVTNGMLTIHMPDQNEDNGNYQCVARNPFGSVLSNKVQISFGYLGDFPRTERDPVYVDEYAGIGIECNPPNHYPDILFAWFKDFTNNFVTSITKPYIFISRNGKLYFSSATDDDEGNYFCQVSSPRQGVTSISGKVSTAIELIVQEAVGSIREPQMASGFPAAYPSSPKQGNDVAIECFAWGTGDLEYSWERIGGIMPPRAYKSEYNRILHIPNVELVDSGEYRCMCWRVNGQSNSASLMLHVDAEPFFTAPITNQHIDIGSTMRLLCIANGIPAVSYSWYINTTRLEIDNIDPEQRGRFEINYNSLVIRDMNREDQGMYQCGAQNLYGIRYSTAQVRVLAFAPTFSKYPLQANTYGTLNGETTIMCNPEAAPRASKQWKKDNRFLTFSNSVSGNIRLLPNGNLFFSSLRSSDVGVYTCVASNDYGEASSTGNLTVLSTTTITSTPIQNKVVVNGTAFIPCQASYNPLLDVTYIWYHNDREVEFLRVRYLGNQVSIERDEHYSRGSGINSGGLYIHNAQFFHEGKYRCMVEMSSQNIRMEVDLYVLGPPSQPAAVTGYDTTQNSIRLQWLPTRENGGPILSYIVEANNEYEGYWKEVKSNIVGADRDNHDTLVEGLDAWSAYQFRVRAVNKYGIGDPSDSSTSYTTAQAQPYKRVQNVGGGGGKVGTLEIRWDPLPRWEWNGEGLRYIVQWKKHLMEDEEYEEEVITDPTVRSYTALVFSINFYTQYDVRVLVRNNLGFGPEPYAPVLVYSAEGIPIGTPTNVQANMYNGTALLVTWRPVEETREKIGGVLLGYRINYWKEVGETEEMAIYRPLAGQRSSGLIIGLESHTYYYVNLQVFNSAGNGPKSQSYNEETLRSPPRNAPTEVKVEALNDHTINVRWRGVQTDYEEEPLQGYYIRYWRASESYYQANDVDALRENHMRVSGFQPDVLYNLRILGYSLGGEGLASSPTIQFMLGPSCAVFQASPERRFVYTCGASSCHFSYVLITALSLCHIFMRWS